MCVCVNPNGDLTDRMLSTTKHSRVKIFTFSCANIHTMKTIHPHNTAPQWPLELAHFGNTDHDDHRSSNDQTSISQQISQGFFTTHLHLCHNVKYPMWPGITIFF